MLCLHTPSPETKVLQDPAPMSQTRLACICLICLRPRTRLRHCSYQRLQLDKDLILQLDLLPA